MTLPGKRMAHDHHFIDEKFNAFAEAARLGKFARFQLEDGIARLRHHFWVEEEFVFPPMAHSHAGPVSVMLRQHGEIWDLADELEQLLDQVNPDPAMALTLFSVFRQVMDAHNATEDSILYPITDDMLGEELSRVLLEALSTDMPAGWRCAMAKARV